ncbi:MAG: hypothetical protein WDW38_000039 [Sanguina aurantia]
MACRCYAAPVDPSLTETGGRSDGAPRAPGVVRSAHCVTATAASWSRDFLALDASMLCQCGVSSSSNSSGSSSSGSSGSSSSGSKSSSGSSSVSSSGSSSGSSSSSPATPTASSLSLRSDGSGVLDAVAATWVHLKVAAASVTLSFGVKVEAEATMEAASSLVKKVTRSALSVWGGVTPDWSSQGLWGSWAGLVCVV